MSEVLLTSAGPVCRHLDLSTGHLPVAERDACVNRPGFTGE